MRTVSATAAAAPAAPPTLTRAQLKAQLWADAALRVVAVVMGTRVPGLPERLAAADIVDHDCLRAGALTREQQHDAAYLVQLQQESDFTDWLLFDAAAGLPDWGVLALSAATPLALRSHLRSLAEARLPEGQVIDLDWMDPPILRALLAHADAAALQGFMGPMRSLVLPGATQWSRADLTAGTLQWRDATVAKAG